MGFVGRQFDYTSSATLYNMATIKALHNDFMKLYIDLGFSGFIVWCSYWLMYIPRKLIKRFDPEVSYSCLLIIIYSFITYMTDNTEGYFNYQMILVMIITTIVISGVQMKSNAERNSNVISDT